VIHVKPNVPGHVLATEASAEAHAERAIDDPRKLAHAVRIIRKAIERGRMTVDELTAPREAA
jgi:hypothetical protein